MAYDSGLAQRVREALAHQAGITEKKMFGGLAFLLDGKMFVGISGSALMARVGAERYAQALAQPHVRPMDFTGRPLTGYVYIDPPALHRDPDLAAWVGGCVRHVAALPAKPPKLPKPPKPPSPPKRPKPPR